MQKTFKGVKTISLNGGNNVTVVPQRLGFWSSKVSVDNYQNGGVSYDEIANTLNMQAYQGNLYVPAGRKLSYVGKKDSGSERTNYLSGIIVPEGELDGDITPRKLKIDQKKDMTTIGDIAKELFQDTVAIGGTVGASIAACNALGVSPADYWDSIGVLTTAVVSAYRGFKGQARVLTNAIGLGLILTPDLLEGGVSAVGGGDLAQFLLLGAGWGMGEYLRRKEDVSHTKDYFP